MQKKKITIQGRELELAYNMAVVIDVERLTGKRFDVDNLSEVSQQLGLVWCAIKRYNDVGSLSMDEWAEGLSFDDFAMVENAMAELIRDFYKLPVGEPVESVDDKKDDDEKNA